MKKEDIIGITIIRNEGDIIKDTLNHFSTICGGGIVVVDDASTDDTYSKCLGHPAVIEVIKNEDWESDRINAQGKLRNIALTSARKNNTKWLFYFDADERPEIDIEALDENSFDAVAMRLFDFYITPEDVDKPYKSRTKMGPEYRDILMLFRDTPEISFNKNNRELTLPKTYRKLKRGYVKHYGKAISIKEWEETCDYYDKNMRKQYGDKWAKRRGKAIHTISDFGYPLITWDEKEAKGVPMIEAEKQFNKK